MLNVWAPAVCSDYLLRYTVAFTVPLSSKVGAWEGVGRGRIFTAVTSLSLLSIIINSCPTVRHGVRYQLGIQQRQQQFPLKRIEMPPGALFLSRTVCYTLELSLLLVTLSPNHNASAV